MMSTMGEIRERFFQKLQILANRDRLQLLDQEWIPVSEDWIDETVASWVSHEHKRMLNVVAIHPRDSFVFNYFFDVVGKDLLPEEDQRSILMVFVKDVDAHADFVYQIYRMWLVDNVPLEILEGKLLELETALQRKDQESEE